MKKLVAVLLVAMLLIASSAMAEENLAGGWMPAETPEITEEAKAAFDTALETLVGCTYEPVALLGTQVVAGTNYCILCAATPVVQEPTVSYVLMYIYADLQGGAEITNITTLDIAALSTAE